MKTRENVRGLTGLIVMNKPAGVTSRDVVDLISRPLKGTKVGHAGTLDPLATGVLVVAVGAATRLIEYVQRMPKTYRTTILLGVRSKTDDADGTITPNPDAIVPSIEAVQAAVATQLGTILQRPPGYSALKLQGRRAYALARAGKTVELAPRPVEHPSSRTLSDSTGRGWSWRSTAAAAPTSARSRDIGETLGCGGLVEVLTRTRIGPFVIEDATDPGGITLETIPNQLRPSAEAVAALPKVNLSAEQVVEVMQGRAIAGVVAEDGEVAMFGPDGLVGIGESKAGWIQPRRILAGPIPAQHP